MKSRIKYGLLFSLLMTLNSVVGQRAGAILDSTSILIGDQVSLTLTFKAQRGTDVQWPYQQDTITKKIEVINQSAIDSLAVSDDSLFLRQKLLITSFDTGYLAIPPFGFEYNMDGNPQVAKTDPLLLHVRAMEVDTTQPIRAIKGPMGAPLTFMDLLPWLLAALALILIGVLVWYIIWRKRQQKPILPVREKPRDPADVEALKALDSLERKKLWQGGNIKAYYTELSHIIRVYLERRFNIPAVESTSGEILRSLKKVEIDKQASKQLKELMEISDLAKFARLEPIASENEKALKGAYDVVNITKPSGDTVSANQTAGKGGPHVE